jgi:hypothetical protein
LQKIEFYFLGVKTKKNIGNGNNTVPTVENRTLTRLLLLFKELSHEKVGEIRPLNIRLSSKPPTKHRHCFKNLSERPINSCGSSKIKLIKTLLICLDLAPRRMPIWNPVRDAEYIV